jgi:hypothetical protein
VCRHQRDSALLTRYLSLLGFERDGAKRIMLDGLRGHIWVHSEKFTSGREPVEILKERLNAVPELDDEDECEFS